jgi:hypothetical protein
MHENDQSFSFDSHLFCFFISISRASCACSSESFLFICFNECFNKEIQMKKF